MQHLEDSTTIRLAIPRVCVAKFTIGQVIKHKMFAYYGIIYDVDPIFLGSDEWYDAVAQSRPPKDEPWYKVLVDNKGVETYVAETNLKVSGRTTIDHPLLPDYFKQTTDGIYVARRLTA